MAPACSAAKPSLPTEIKWCNKNLNNMKKQSYLALILLILGLIFSSSFGFKFNLSDGFTMLVTGFTSLFNFLILQLSAQMKFI